MDIPIFKKMNHEMVCGGKILEGGVSTQEWEYPKKHEIV